MLVLRSHDIAPLLSQPTGMGVCVCAAPHPQVTVCFSPFPKPQAPFYMCGWPESLKSQIAFLLSHLLPWGLFPTLGCGVCSAGLWAVFWVI